MSDPPTPRRDSRTSAQSRRGSRKFSLNSRRSSQSALDMNDINVRSGFQRDLILLMGCIR